jgi:hypothetical protein
MALVLAVALIPGAAVAGEGPHPLLAQIERLSRLKDGEDPVPLLEAVSDGIAADPGAVLAPLIQKVGDPEMAERPLAVHVWALGLTRDAAAIDPLVALYRRSASVVVQRSCLQALATIGGPRAGTVVAAALDAASEPDVRFEILALLAQMHHADAARLADELLGLDPGRFSWQSVMVFGKLGDQAVPHLLSKLADPDRHVRMNAIHVLGLWLLAPEAAAPLAAGYWSEGEPEVRELMLNALQLTLGDLATVQRFFEQVVQREPDGKLVAFARETLGTVERLRADARQLGEQRPAGGRSFQEVWEELYRSAGRTGDYAALWAASRPGDEGRLKVLRERILQRHSDEALRDYQRVNRIILRNRLAESAER